jgi:hypothetical protein
MENTSLVPELIKYQQQKHDITSEGMKKNESLSFKINRHILEAKIFSMTEVQSYPTKCKSNQHSLTELTAFCTTAEAWGKLTWQPYSLILNHCNHSRLTHE